MSKKSSKLLLLFLILAFAFTYRLILMTWNTFPPGADIGLHESVVQSIAMEGNGFSWNAFHMGGGVSATNPGYHIFVATFIAFTGTPDYLAQAIVASFFSAFIVLGAFLLVRSLWSETAALIAAFLVAFSSGDIAILVWGGYPNIATLMLIHIVFYLYLQRSKFSRSTYFIATSLLVGAMFLTHVFSTLVFITITGIALLLAMVFRKKTNLSKTHVVSWVLPIAFGAILVSPYLLQNLPVYFGSESTVMDSASVMKQALLETRLIPFNLVLLSLIPFFLFFLLSKLYRGKFITVQAVLLAVWVLIPAVLTQSYVTGVYVDYERFLYFLFLPVTICIALLLTLGAHALSRVFNLLQFQNNGIVVAASRTLFGKVTYSAVIVSFLLSALFFIPFFTTPNAGVTEVGFFQDMTKPGYEAIQWIKTNTSPDAVFVADADFGWWLSGFAQRPTLSAVDPQYLILSREFEPAKVAGNLLETDYFIDNGLLRVTQDSQYAKNSPEFSGWLNNSYVPYRFFSLNEDQISIVYRENNIPKQVSFADTQTAEMQVVSDATHASFVTTRENQLFNTTEEITLFKGARFAKISLTLQANVTGVSFDWLHLPFQQRGLPTEYANAIATVDEDMQVLSQMIFPDETLGTTVSLQENSNAYELVYDLEGKNTVQAQFYVGLSQIQADLGVMEQDKLQGLIVNNTNTYLDRVSDLPLDFFNYKNAIREWNVSYIVVRNEDSIPRLVKDDYFSLVFKNDEIAIFQVTNQPQPET